MFIKPVNNLMLQKASKNKRQQYVSKLPSLKYD